LNPFQKNRNGFSIIEVIVALALAAIVIFLYMGLFSDIFKLSVLAHKKGMDIYRSQKTIEKVIANSTTTNASVVAVSSTPIELYFEGVTVVATGKVVEDRASSPSNFYIFVPEE
jgi:prepilin-type N-terminal cleavage/methylation domain-containing protein